MPIALQDMENAQNNNVVDEKSSSNHHAVSDWGKNTHNPLNWSPTRRWIIIIVLATTNFVAYVACLVSYLAQLRLTPT